MLIAMFAAATFLPVNMGVLALVGAFIIGGAYTDLLAEDIALLFPGDLFVLLVGGHLPVCDRTEQRHDRLDGQRIGAGRRGALFLASLVFNTLVAVVVFIVFGGLALLTRRVSEEGGNDQGSETASGRGARRESSTGADDDRGRPEQQQAGRGGGGGAALLTYGAIVVAVAPVLLWLALVVPGS